jgi:choline dehydrogenase-like flavoprotein
MPRFRYDDEDVVVIIGSGAGGGTLANELAQKGQRVVLLEAGRHRSPDEFVNDEWRSFKQLAWLDKRTTSGSFRVARDFPNLPAWTCKTVGGTTVHWAGCCPRFMEHEFKASTYYDGIDGANALDWPISLADVEPYYDRAERKLGITGTNGIGQLPANNNYKVFANGAQRVGYKRFHTGRYACNPVPRDGRPATIQDGFTFQGNKNRSRWSTLYTEIPRALTTGKLDLRPQSHVIRVETDDKGLATGVTYIDADGLEQFQRARIVSVACNAIETPRLLLNSTANRFPDGLANSSGQLGRNYMRHLTASVYAIFDKPVHMYRGETMAGHIEDEAPNDPSRGFVGGYYLQLLSLGVPFMAAFVDPGAWGRDFASIMEGYENMAGLWLVGEDMPQASNRVTLNHDEVDQYGQPVPNVHFDDHANDLAMREHAWSAGEALYESVGAVRTIRTPPYPATHNIGTARMSERPQDGVVNAFGQAHDVPNLFVSDASQFTTGAAANPTLTIIALAIRQAEYITEQLRTGAIGSGHAVWDSGRDPGGAAPGSDGAPDAATEETEPAVGAPAS